MSLHVIKLIESKGWLSIHTLRACSFYSTNTMLVDITRCCWLQVEYKFINFSLYINWLQLECYKYPLALNVALSYTFKCLMTSLLRRSEFMGSIRKHNNSPISTKAQFKQQVMVWLVWSYQHDTEDIQRISS